MKPLTAQSEIIQGRGLTKMKRFDYENLMIAKAKTFSAIIGMAHNRVSVECASLEEAKQAARVLVIDSMSTPNKGKHAMVYADSVYVGKVNGRVEWMERTP
jgi:KaiC/GvpD/RAD55 family RecA-like ATPase